MTNLHYQTGGVINSGTWLGRYANKKSQDLCLSGQSNGPHVHFYCSIMAVLRLYIIGLSAIIE